MPRVQGFFFPYTGTNTREVRKNIYPYIEFEGINKIVEPFCGSSSFSRNIPDEIKPNIKSYHFNDIDPFLNEFITDVRNGKIGDYVKHTKLICDEYKDNKKMDLMKYGFKYYLFFKKLLCRCGHLIDLKKVAKIEEYETKMQPLIDFYKNENVKITTHDYLEILDKYKDDPEALIYLDPPYLDSYNGDYSAYGEVMKNKVIVDNTEMYVKIMKFMKKAKCRVYLSINSNALNKYLFRKLEIENEYDVLYNLSHKKTQHLLISNSVIKS